jgi:hypothetical protein
MANDPPPSTQEQSDVSEIALFVRRLSWLAYIGAGVAVIVASVYLYNFPGPLSRDHGRWAEFGDFVGGLLNPTFAFLALLALLAALGLQVRELRMSVKELAKSAEALAKQNETLRLQTFEGTFFQTLRLHNEIVNSMRMPERSLSGRDCLRFLADELRGTLLNEGATERVEDAIVFYEHFYRDRPAALGHYYRMLYNLVKFVNRSDGIDKRFYTNLVRAQLSQSELYLLFYNCLSSLGREKFKPLVEEYALLKSMADDESLPNSNHLQAYAPSAFGGKYPKAWL